MENNNENFNEIYKGITRIVKTREHDVDVWFAVIGNTIVSRGTFKTKEDCIKDLETPDYEQYCKIALAIAMAIKDYNKPKVKEV